MAAQAPPIHSFDAMEPRCRVRLREIALAQFGSPSLEFEDRNGQPLRWLRPREWVCVEAGSRGFIRCRITFRNGVGRRFASINSEFRNFGSQGQSHDYKRLMPISLDDQHVAPVEPAI
jgi:hypothetical protein